VVVRHVTDFEFEFNGFRRFFPKIRQTGQWIGFWSNSNLLCGLVRLEVLYSDHCNENCWL